MPAAAVPKSVGARCWRWVEWVGLIRLLQEKLKTLGVFDRAA